MEHCRRIKSCLECILRECFWTNSRRFPCRSGPDETDNQVFQSCSDFNRTNKTINLQSTLATNDGSDTKTHYTWALTIIIACFFLLSFGLLYWRTKYKKNRLHFKQWWQQDDDWTSFVGTELYELLERTDFSPDVITSTPEALTSTLASVAC